MKNIIRFLLGLLGLTPEAETKINLNNPVNGQRIVPEPFPVHIHPELLTKMVEVAKPEKVCAISDRQIVQEAPDVRAETPILTKAVSFFRKPADVTIVSRADGRAKKAKVRSEHGSFLTFKIVGRKGNVLLLRRPHHRAGPVITRSLT